jgi:MFS family permease
MENKTIFNIVFSTKAVVHGFFLTQSELLLMDDNFLNLIDGYDADFMQRFYVLYYFGEFIGSLFSFFLCDGIGRKKTLLYGSVVCLFTILWSWMSLTAANQLTARFVVGLSLGVLISTAPIYIAEVFFIFF